MQQVHQDGDCEDLNEAEMLAALAAATELQAVVSSCKACSGWHRAHTCGRKGKSLQSNLIAPTSCAPPDQIISLPAQIVVESQPTVADLSHLTERQAVALLLRQTTKCSPSPVDTDESTQSLKRKCQDNGCSKCRYSTNGCGACRKEESVKSGTLALIARVEMAAPECDKIVHDYESSLEDFYDEPRDLGLAAAALAAAQEEGLQLARADNSSGYKNVTRDRKKYNARHCRGGIRSDLGSFDTAEEAVLYGLYASTVYECFCVVLCYVRYCVLWVV